MNAAVLLAIALLPQPLQVDYKPGDFVFNKDTVVLVEKDSTDAANVGRQLAQQLGRTIGIKSEEVPSDSTRTANNAVLLTTAGANAALGREGYTLEVTSAGVVISATDGPGLFYGMQTLLQLLPPEVFAAEKPAASVEWRVPAVRIEDKPRFPWRGLMLDVSRHFFTKGEVETFIDVMAQHKMNTFHWHLVDQQGWRIEIKRYPKLTQIGAWRDGTGFGLDPKATTAYGPDGRYGGFYTQDDIREVLAYAKQRYVTIVPEIEMPGHSTAAVTAYPQYHCTGLPLAAGENLKQFGVYCAGNDDTFDFLEGVLTEVMELFPSKYIHVGGDEVMKGNWKNCPKCQARMSQEGLKDEKELQGYFIRRIEKFVNMHHRTLIGWDEILEGGLTPDSAVMGWRGAKAGIAAANAGHDVVMTPESHCYLNFYQAVNRADEPTSYPRYLPLWKVYSFDPLPPQISADKVKHVLGIDGNLWSEYIENLSGAQYAAYPRACAIADLAWSDPKYKNWDDFMRRLEPHLKRLKAQGVSYRQPRPSDDGPPGK